MPAGYARLPDGSTAARPDCRPDAGYTAAPAVFHCIAAASGHQTDPVRIPDEAARCFTPPGQWNHPPLWSRIPDSRHPPDLISLRIFHNT